jgi:hypothetical protein
VKLSYDRKNPQRNGVTKPGDETMSGHVWVLIERYRKDNGGQLPAPDTLWKLYSDSLEGASKSTLTTQFSRYVRYHGCYLEQEQMRERERAASADRRRAKRKQQYAAKKVSA